MRRLLYVAIAAASLALPGVASAQTFDGSTLTYQYYYPNSTSPYSNSSNGSFVVGPGVEVTNVADNMATLDVSGNNIYVDFTDQSSWNPSSFNGWVLSDDTNNLASILGVSINPMTNLAGFSMSNISFTNDQISVNWQGIGFDSNSVLSLDVDLGRQVPAVPEPATWAMMLFGFGGIGYSMRRRRKAQSTLQVA